MSGFALDTNIVIDAVSGYRQAAMEFRHLAITGERIWISRMVWIEVMSKGTKPMLDRAELFMSDYGIDEMDEDIARRAASLRRERPRLKSPDAIILATAQIRDRVLVTRNTKDFPAEMPGIRVPYML